MLSLEEHCVATTDTLVAALKKIDINGNGIVFVVDQGILVGSLTDGDVRRAFISGVNGNNLVKQHYNSDVVYRHFKASEIDIINATNSHTKVIPIVDDNKKIVDIATISRPHNVVLMEPSLDGNEMNYVVDCLKTNWISSQGAYVELFEKKLAEFFDVKYCLAVSNGTVALHLGLLSLNIGAGDELLVLNLWCFRQFDYPLRCNACLVRC